METCLLAAHPPQKTVHNAEAVLECGIKEYDNQSEK